MKPSIPTGGCHRASSSSLWCRALAPHHTVLVPIMLQPGMSSQGCQSNHRNTTNSNNTEQTVCKHSPLIFSPVWFVLFPLSHKEAAAIRREQQYYSSVQPAPSQQELWCRAPGIARKAAAPGEEPGTAELNPDSAKGSLSCSPASSVLPARVLC